MMEEIIPTENHPNSSGNKSLMEFWIKILGKGIVLQGFSMFLIQAPWDTITLTLACGLVLICGKRNQLIRTILICFIGFLVGATATWFFINTKLEPDRFRAIYFFISFFFDIGLFIFLLTPDVKASFGPSPLPKSLPLLTSQEERRIKFLTRVVAVGLLISWTYYRDFKLWFQNPSLIETIGLTLSIVVSFSLFYFRENLGRKLALFLSALMLIDSCVSLTRLSSYSNFEYLRLIAIFIFYLGISFLSDQKLKLYSNNFLILKK